ncbi:protein-glutamine gamma-glutamyltransferase [Paenibacillus sp.]|uniref:protein-glutamine gamma-glutamyltransferase n=1 Tax=Paenibacillus sp. TaxID=58172 RepID=UPI00281201C8|nr:protein-glutamine gamma-glutamyltransferase [Paenibacillus sp.]
MIHILQSDGSSLPGVSETRLALLTLLATRTNGAYPSVRDLDFELRMREATLEAARALNVSGVGFETFEHSRCNEDYWRREPNGAFRLRSDRKPSEALRDIYDNGPVYGFECATAIVIVFYKAALDMIGGAAYDRLFANTLLFHWNVDRDLGLTTIPSTRFVPGDCLYFDNPDVDPATMQWQGENVIYMGGDSYYGHGIGIRSADAIVAKLNEHRRPGAFRSAFLLPQTTRPTYMKLAPYAQHPSPSPGSPGLPFRARIGAGAYWF